MFLNGFNSGRAAFRLAHHGDESRLAEHHVGELIHTRRCGGARWANYLFTHGVHRADVIDHAVFKVHGQRLPFGQHVADALVSGVAPREHLAVQQKGLTRPPAGDLFFG